MEGRRQLRSRRNLWILVAFWIALLPLFASWLSADRTYAPWDSALHVELAMRLREGWARPNPWAVYELSKFYPPLFHVLALPAALVSDHPDVFAFGSLISLLGLMTGTYLLGRTLSGERAGLAAGLLVASYIYVTWLGRQVMTDLASSATVALALWRLSVPHPLGDRRSARLLGGSLALGMLTKWAFALFLAAPLTWFIVRFLRDDTGPDRGRRVATAVGWAIVPVAPWYIRSASNLVGQAGWHLGGGVRATEGDPSPLSWESLLYYPKALWNLYLTWPLATLLAVGAVCAATAWRAGACGIAPARRWTPSILAVAGGAAALLAIANKDARYVMPATSVIAVASTAWIARLPLGWSRAVVGAIAILSALTIAWNLFVFAPPDRREWRVEETAARIAQRMNENGGPFRVLVVPNTWWMNWMSLRLAIDNAFEGDGKIWVDSLEGPLGRDDLHDYGSVVLVYPPPSEEPISRGTAVAAEWVLHESGWHPYAAFPRDDGRAVILLEPPG